MAIALHATVNLTKLGFEPRIKIRDGRKLLTSFTCGIPSEDYRVAAKNMLDLLDRTIAWAPQEFGFDPSKATVKIELSRELIEA